MIGATKINQGDWEQSAALFEKKIADWNECTRHYAIPHPSFAISLTIAQCAAKRLRTNP
ncbi:hypothetical protein EC036_24830 [Enterobacter cloacae]|nr:hypothetical protein EC036_24830 [Enterobacter cloacae]